MPASVSSCKNYDTRLYLRNVDGQTNKVALRAIFANYGPVRTLELARNPRDTSFLGYGLVEYQRAEDAQRALRARPTIVLDGREIHVDKFVSKDERDASKPITNLYVANFLGDIVADEVLEDMFRRFGEITSAKVQIKNDQPTGCGFVNYRNADDALRAIEELNGRMLPSGKLLKVQPFMSKEEKQRAERRARNVERQRHQATVNGAGGRRQSAPVVTTQNVRNIQALRQRSVHTGIPTLPTVPPPQYRPPPLLNPRANVRPTPGRANGLPRYNTVDNIAQIGHALPQNPTGAGRQYARSNASRGSDSSAPPRQRNSRRRPAPEARSASREGTSSQRVNGQQTRYQSDSLNSVVPAQEDTHTETGPPENGMGNRKDSCCIS